MKYRKSDWYVKINKEIENGNKILYMCHGSTKDNWELVVFVRQLMVFGIEKCYEWEIRVIFFWVGDSVEVIYIEFGINVKYAITIY